MKHPFLFRLLCLLLCCGMAGSAFAAGTLETRPNRYIYSGYEAPLVDTGISFFGLDDDLPESFDLRNHNGQSYLTEVRDQGLYGTCWAHAALASVESNLLMNGYKGYPDLSELHLVNYTYHRTPSLSALGGGTRGDLVAMRDLKVPQTEDEYNASKVAVMQGGNAQMAIDTLGSWWGAVPESVLPYPSVAEIGEKMAFDPPLHARKVMEGTLEDSYARSYNVLQFDHAYAVSAQQPAEIKKLLMEHGAATLSVYYHPDYLSTDGEYYYFSDYDENSGITVNHGITLVGWDDTIPKESFKTPAPYDGAWLCRNSYGENYHGDGYFWISYAEPLLLDIVFFSMKPIEQGYDRLYQYDGSIVSGAFDAGEQAVMTNVFAAESNELLSAISLDHMSTANADVKVEIYTGIPQNGTPQQGTLRSEATTEKHLTYAGTEVIPLRRPVQLKAGEKFAVVVTMESTVGTSVYPSVSVSGNTGNYVAVEQTYPLESLLMQNGQWADLHGQLTFKIKAMSQVLPEFTPPAAGDSAPPATGDSAQPLWWLAAMALSAAVLALCLAQRKKLRGKPQ